MLRYNIFSLYVNTYHNKLNDMMKEFSINGEKIPMQKVLLIGKDPIQIILPYDLNNNCVIGKWIKTYYEPGLASLGVEAKKPDLLQTLDPLIMLYRAHIRVCIMFNLILGNYFGNIAYRIFKLCWKAYLR